MKVRHLSTARDALQRTPDSDPLVIMIAYMDQDGGWHTCAARESETPWPTIEMVAMGELLKTEALDLHYSDGTVVSGEEEES